MVRVVSLKIPSSLTVVKQCSILSKYNSSGITKLLQNVLLAKTIMYSSIGTKIGSDKSLAYEWLPLVRASRLVHLTLAASNLCISIHAFSFAVIYTKGEEKVCTRGVKKVLQIDIQKIHKALEFDLI